MTRRPDFDPMGHVTPPEDLEALDRIAERIGYQYYALEVGSWAGLSALVLTKCFCGVFCVDNWQSGPEPIEHGPEIVHYPNALAIFCRNMGSQLFRRVFPCVGDSLFWASVWNQPLGLVYLDGDHDYEAVRSDIIAWMPHVAPKGVICGHDYGSFPGVTRAVDEILPNRKLAGRFLWYQEVV